MGNKTLNRVRCRWCGNTILYMTARTTYWYHKKSGEAQCRYKRRVATPRLDTPPELLFQAGLDRILKKVGSTREEVVKTTYRIMTIGFDVKASTQLMQLPACSQVLAIVPGTFGGGALVIKIVCTVLGEPLPRFIPHRLMRLMIGECVMDISDQEPAEYVGMWDGCCYFLRRQP